MRYSSTRGGVVGRSFEEALFSGYASDGGIFLPDSIPALSPETLHRWAALPYTALVTEILQLFISREEIPENHLKELVGKAFADFADPEGVVHLKRLGSGLNVLELFHGPTLAFKDLALSVLGHLLDYFLQKKQQHVTIVVGTSGDTGSAAIHSVRGLRWADMVVLLPRGRCTEIQERMMTTVLDDNIHVIRVDGTSDDLDRPILACFSDTEFVTKHHLLSINSINWGRIVVQVAHYFYGYFQMRPECEGEVEIIVPTGACGNVTAGCVAHKMGLPVKLVCSTNSNDIVARTISKGDFSVNGEIKPTLAPAMDIQYPYNTERLVWLFSEHDTGLIQRLQKQFDTEGKTVIPNDVLNKMQTVLGSCSVSDEGIKEAMRQCWEEDEYTLCPHTATAAWYHYHHPRETDGGGLPRVCIATASPAKFEAAVVEAGLPFHKPALIRDLETLPTRSKDWEKGEDWVQNLKSTIQDISLVWKPPS